MLYKASKEGVVASSYMHEAAKVKGRLKSVQGTHPEI